MVFEFGRLSLILFLKTKLLKKYNRLRHVRSLLNTHDKKSHNWNSNAQEIHTNNTAKR